MGSSDVDHSSDIISGFGICDFQVPADPGKMEADYHRGSVPAGADHEFLFIAEKKKKKFFCNSGNQYTPYGMYPDCGNIDSGCYEAD